MSKIDTSTWKDFHLYDDQLFEINSGNKFDKNKMNTDDDSINFIGRTAANNGINGKCGIYNNTEPYRAGYLTLALGGSIGACFVQKDKFYTSQNVAVLIPRHEMTYKQKAFIASAIFKTCSSKYAAFVDELNRHIKTDFTIKLPVTASNIIDWSYMEEFMVSCECKASNNVESVRRGEAEPHSLVDTSDWGLFKISELFKVEKIKNKLTKAEVSDSGLYSVYSSETANGGIQGYISSAPEFIINKTPMLIFGDHTKAMNIATQSFSVMDNVKVLTPLFPATVNLLLFIISVWKAYIPDLGYARHWSVASNLIIKLPSQSNGIPDWEYMENYIENFKSNT